MAVGKAVSHWPARSAVFRGLNQVGLVETEREPHRRAEIVLGERVRLEAVLVEGDQDHRARGHGREEHRGCYVVAGVEVLLVEGGKSAHVRELSQRLLQAALLPLSI